MQKAVLKQQFEAFTISGSEGLEKGYDRFQQLLSQLEAHGAEVSTEDANYKFLRSLPPAWSNLAMTKRTKPDVDTLSIDDMYNNLRVFKQELTSTLKSLIGTDKTKITRKPSKMGKHGHENGRAQKKPGNQAKVKKSKLSKNSLSPGTKDTKEKDVILIGKVKQKITRGLERAQGMGEYCPLRAPAGLLRQCPHHGFSELHQLDTFYNSLNTNDQDALDSAAGGNFLDKMPRDGLAIIESKSKVDIPEVVEN
ncbi:hypothetical protein Tco_0073598 [Tanacetum coccineum]